MSNRRTAVVVGASGGIGAALVRALAAGDDFDRIHALSRTPIDVGETRVVSGAIDLGDEASIAAAAARIGGPVDLVIVATGVLEVGGHPPERALRELDPATLLAAFAVNTVGPALVLKHVAPMLPRDRRSVVACLSARVGSIGDNRLGGWYGYRASKAALNQIVRTAAIELSRSRPHALCIALHPGTVDTALSRPFQKGVASGQLFTPDFSAGRLLAVIEGLTAADSGGCFAWDGARIPA